MNEHIKKLVIEAAFDEETMMPSDKMYTFTEEKMSKFAELIVKECAAVNEKQALELLGVIADVENGSLFDNTCMNTLKQVHADLSSNIQKHFGVE